MFTISLPITLRASASSDRTNVTLTLNTSERTSTFSAQEMNSSTTVIVAPTNFPVPSSMMVCATRAVVLGSTTAILASGLIGRYNEKPSAGGDGGRPERTLLGERG